MEHQGEPIQSTDPAKLPASPAGDAKPIRVRETYEEFIARVEREGRLIDPDVRWPKRSPDSPPRPV